MIRSLIVATILFCTTMPAGMFARASDAQAIQVLEQAVTAAGGRDAYKQAAEFHASGTLSLYSGDETMETGNADLVGSGLKRFRLTAKFENETRIWVWKDGVGFLLAGNRQPDPIGRHNLTALEGVTLPVLKIIALLDGSSRSIRLVETFRLGGRTAYRIRVTQTPTEHKDRLVLGRDSVTTDLLLDQQTLSVIAIENTISPNGHQRESYEHSVTYGDYHQVNGAQVPFSIQEKISNQLTWGLQLNTFEPTASPSSSEFQLN